MAIQKSPYKRSVYSDLPYVTMLDATGDIAMATNIDAVRQSLFNILHTKKGDRPLNPNFGCMLESYLFEPFDETTGRSIGERIDFALTKWEPRVEVISIDVSLDTDNQIYQVIITYIIRNIQKKDSITFTLQKI